MENYKLTDEILLPLLAKARAEKVKELDKERSFEFPYEYELQLSAYQRVMRELNKTLENTRLTNRERNEQNTK
ncbi:hypothetical protein PPUJ13061_47430 [Pseudomonas putida]|jgi:hypothetical protein|uniref:hypothetical protein n=1 Tax=Pseudomonas putida TaxID=303 RepID=UPI0013B38582|nr:hypothetical protein [Pseudomonas putida]WQE52771.1 hypothetical protein U0028_23280 [Pseudomonas putida]GLO04841.1 hypothetical protein PPUJ13061_47430 [Pseudomonas putida]HDS1007325.1 hypothetical protein [Pseudomonas putida]